MSNIESMPGQLRYFGTASYQGVLTRNIISDPQDPMVGFVSASIDGRPWTDTMWTRDAGVFLREMAPWGRFQNL